MFMMSKNQSIARLPLWWGVLALTGSLARGSAPAGAKDVGDPEPDDPRTEDAGGGHELRNGDDRSTGLRVIDHARRGRARADVEHGVGVRHCQDLRQPEVVTQIARLSQRISGRRGIGVVNRFICGGAARRKRCSLCVYGTSSLCAW